MNYDEFLAKYDNEFVIEIDMMDALKGLCTEDGIAINKKIPTTREKKCICAEEIGHARTTVGNILDQSIVSNRKQELRARDWAVQALLTLDDLIKAVKSGCSNFYEVADFLDVTEEFLSSALDYFKRQYGVSVHHNGYIITFNDGGFGVVRSSSE